MSTTPTPPGRISAAFWLRIQRASRRVNRAARKRLPRPLIDFSADPTRATLGARGLMQMLDVMPSWSFDPNLEAFTTKAAAASREQTVVTQTEMNELLAAVADFRPGRANLHLVGLSWDQLHQVKQKIGAGSEISSAELS
jgi:hypothetical protein